MPCAREPSCCLRLVQAATHGGAYETSFELSSSPPTTAHKGCWRICRDSGWGAIPEAQTLRRPPRDHAAAAPQKGVPWRLRGWFAPRLVSALQVESSKRVQVTIRCGILRAMWMETAREGRVEGIESDGKHRVRLSDGEMVRAVPGSMLKQHQITVTDGDAVLLRPRDDVLEIVLRRRFPEGMSVPLLLPTVDPSVEYLLEPDDPKWLHPYLPYLYDWYDPYDEDLPMWRRLAEEVDGPILELACGTGRVVGDLARRGHRMTGLDISQPMIDRAAEKLAGDTREVRARVEWICGDMSRWKSDRKFPLAFIACNSLHYMGSKSGDARKDLRRRAVETLYRQLEPGGLGVISNIAPLEPNKPRERHRAPRLRILQASVNPNTGLFTAEYQGFFGDDETGLCYDGPWRFLEVRPDGLRHLFEFAPPPETPGEIPLPNRLPALTRDETTALMRESGFTDLEVRRMPDLLPIRDEDRIAVFLGRKPRNAQ